jgi:hypothetical protein
MNNLAQDPCGTSDRATFPASDANIPSGGPQSGVLPNIPRRRTGKIASLPLSIRDQINQLIQDGVPYEVIIEKLESPDAPPLPRSITKNNLSDWKDGGYQDWLKDQFWREEMRARFEAFSGLLNGADPIQLPEGGLQLAAIGLCELLRGLSNSGAAGKPDPDKYVRAANSLARLSSSNLTIQQYRAACAEAQAKVRELKDPKRKLTEDERRAIILQVDEILGIGRGGKGGC